MARRGARRRLKGIRRSPLGHKAMGTPRPPHAGRAEFLIDQLQLFLEELAIKGTPYLNYPPNLSSLIEPIK